MKDKSLNIQLKSVIFKIIISFIFAAAAFISCNNANTNSTSTKGLEVASPRAEIKYQCPMKCEGDTAYTTEGQCPVCKMDLEKI